MTVVPGPGAHTHKHMTRRPVRSDAAFSWCLGHRRLMKTVRPGPFCVRRLCRDGWRCFAAFPTGDPSTTFHMCGKDRREPPSGLLFSLRNVISEKQPYHHESLGDIMLTWRHAAAAKICWLLLCCVLFGADHCCHCSLRRSASALALASASRLAFAAAAAAWPPCALWACQWPGLLAPQRLPPSRHGIHS